MKQHSVLLAVAATAIIAALAGCSTHSPYYDKDGPPSVGAHIENQSFASTEMLSRIPVQMPRMRSAVPP